VEATELSVRITTHKRLIQPQTVHRAVELRHQRTSYITNISYGSQEDLPRNTGTITCANDTLWSGSKHSYNKWETFLTT